MSPVKADAKAHEAHQLNRETEHLINTIKAKDARLRAWFMVSWTILLVIGIFGIYRQNQIANQNKQHIDCIVKLFTTPLPADAKSRTINNAQTTCNITFVR